MKSRPPGQPFVLKGFFLLHSAPCYFGESDFLAVGGLRAIETPHNEWNSLGSARRLPHVSFANSTLCRFVKVAPFVMWRKKWMNALLQ